jgi:hypothetical protein
LDRGYADVWIWTSENSTSRHLGEKGKEEGPRLVCPDPSWHSKVLLFISSRSPL